VVAALLIVAGIAAVDSLNPATVAPALALAVSARPVERVLAFTAGVFVVNVLGGLLLVFGPGKWLFSLIPHRSDHATHVLELVAGLALLVGAGVLLALRKRLTNQAKDPEPDVKAGSGAGAAFVTGAALALAELPTAFPYFAAIAAIDAAVLSAAGEVTLIVIFNLIFLSPLIAIAIGLALFPSLRESVIEPIRRWMSAHWPQVVAAILAVAGIALIAVGASGLAGD
jgi:cytochrome c biogenesis protein CcdA